MNHGAMQPFGLTLDKFLDHAARWHPDAEVITAREGESPQRIGYAALRDRARQLSAALADLSVARDDCVATLAWNGQGHLEAWYAIAGMGAVCHTLNPRLAAHRIAEQLAASQARVLFVSVDLLASAVEIAALDTAVEHFVVLDGEPEADVAAQTIRQHVHTLDTLLAGRSASFVWGDFDENQPAGLCFTSGTTGAPKGVTYTHRSSYLHTLRVLQADAIGITARDVVLAVVPMFHANGWGLSFAAPAVGANLVLPGRGVNGPRLAALISEFGVTVAAGVPTVWIGLVEHLETHGGDVASLERILVGGAPMPPALMARIESRLGATIQTSWGMTELSPVGTMSSPEQGTRAAAVSGRPAVGMDLKLFDAAGEPLAEQRNVEGYLRVRGPSVVARYFQQDEWAIDAEGWFDTGDLARIDNAGNLTITGRAKDLIKSGGEWINPAEIEAIIGALDEVAMAAVIGRPDATWGERPVLIVEIREGCMLDDEAIRAHLKARVASWWLPDDIVRLETMPTAATGKIDKQRLRTSYTEN